MTSPTVEDQLAAAREAADRHAWREAYDGLEALDRERRLDGAGLELLGQMAWWAQKPDVAVSARERAHSAYLEEGDRVRAALMALFAADDHESHMADAVAQGWWARAGRILREEPESVAHGYMAFFQGIHALRQGDFERASELGSKAVDFGARFGDRDLQGFGLACRGMALVRKGEIDEGLLQLDEATAAAVAGELSPFATGMVYCSTISTCRDLADYRRAGQWTEVAERWCERQSISGFPGVCRVHRAEILSLRGDWGDAEEEARRASEELLSFKASFQAAEGFYALGEIRLRLGDYEGADEAFRQAQDLGREPQPGRALLYLSQGRVDAAMSSIERAMEWLSAGSDRLTKAKVLPARVEIAIAAQNLDVAKQSADEIETIARDFGSSALIAASQYARGLVHIAESQSDAALRELNMARTRWQSIDVPFEVARTRMAIARAFQLHGELDEARIEAEAAHAAFMRLGAAPAAVDCQRLLEQLRPQQVQGERQRRSFMFTDIVGSTDLLSVIGDEAWGDLKRWHDQTLRRVAAEFGGEEINEAGDGFFFAFSDVRSAVDCAIGIQRALAEHRRSSGFAPRVRIGLHAAEATRVENSYLGQGVHAAARIGAQAGASEILASAETLAGEAIEGASPPRAVELKGIPGAVEIQTIAWAAPS